MNELCVLQDDVPAFANEVCTFLNLFLLNYYYFLLVCLNNVVLSNLIYWDFHGSSCRCLSIPMSNFEES